MSARDSFQGMELDEVEVAPVPARPRFGLVLGELVAMVDEGRCPLVSYEGMAGAALPARSLVALSAAHIGRPLALMFEGGDLSLPVVTGLLHGQPGWPLAERPAHHVQVEAGGERLIVSARNQLVLRCGKSSVTLNENGHIEIRGETIVTQAQGANRIRGGSVELN
ncbi:DUF6484 domain-containing protein [Sphaerotilaceae bacterium SBD11-9]